MALLNDSNTREIFELTKRLNAAVFSYSDIGHESSYRKYGLIKNGELKYLKDMDIVGDVNLDFLNEKGERVPNRINDRVIAMPITEIKKIRNVIGLAYGERKVAVTLAVLKGRILNILIIDKIIADNIIS